MCLRIFKPRRALDFTKVSRHEALLKSCFEDLVNYACKLLFATILSWIHHISIFAPNHCHNFKISELLLETSKNHGIFD